MQVIFTAHAAQRIFERNLDADDVEHVALHGEVIMSYPDDKPYPSQLLLGFFDGMPLHVLIANDSAASCCHIITVYVPDAAIWQPDFKTKK